jgi:demethylmenaquinone methyltransferase / 2-methoxy-6-polyprenyl-1,4-benzoquinol methylase
LKGPRTDFIVSMFGEVAPKYDLANDVLSLGIHKLWKAKLIRQGEEHVKSLSTVSVEILDCATGTGDLAFAFGKKFRSQKNPSHIVGTDFCEPMLAVAKARLEKFKANEFPETKMEFVHADGQKLPFNSDRFQVASISFGIRNYADPTKGLSEMHRVLAPGGKILVLEFGQPEWAPFAKLYQWYSRKIMPVIGGLISGKPFAYEYLESSAAHFPSGKKFLRILERSGNWRNVQVVSLTGGIAYLYSAIKN